MKLHTGLALAAFCVLGSARAVAHGGRYLGPGDLVADEERVFGPTAVPSPGARSEVETHLASWEFWWGVNQTRYLEYADGVEPPTLDDLRTRVAPALLHALEVEHANDIVGGCLMSLARVGRRLDAQETKPFAERITALLASSSQDIAETAALALGLLGRDDAYEPLKDLVLDSETGRRLVKAVEVRERTRAFASHALGLLRERTQSAELRERVEALLVLQCLVPQSTETAGRTSPALRIASLVTLGAAPITLEGRSTRMRSSSPERQSRIRWAAEFLADSSKPALERAHAPRALASLALTTDAAAVAFANDVLLTQLADPAAGEVVRVVEPRRACVLALGQLGAANSAEQNRKVRARLTALATSDADAQLRAFALVSLAQVGAHGKDAALAVQKFLVEQLDQRPSERPWAALALGVHARACAASGTSVDDSVRTVLRKKLADARPPGDVGALALACGLARDVEAREILLKRLTDGPTDEARGNVAVALGMLGDPSAAPALRDVLKKSRYKPDLLRRVATALGMFGLPEDITISATLLEDVKGLSSQASLAESSAFRRSTRSVAPLLAMVADDVKLTDSARGFAAAAVGLVCSDERWAWSTLFARDLDYRASSRLLVDDDNCVGVLQRL